MLFKVAINIKTLVDFQIMCITQWEMNSKHLKMGPFVFYRYFKLQSNARLSADAQRKIGQMSKTEHVAFLCSAQLPISF